jgi:photosystem II stability/assembly factor-like uncharacterized protein
MMHVPSSGFVTTDNGRHWRAAIGGGSFTPRARGVPPAHNNAEADVADGLDVVDSRAAVLLTSCSPCGDSQHPDGFLGLERTADEGRHWITYGAHRGLPLVGPNGPAAVSFLTPTRGYLLAGSAAGPPTLRLLRTADGGHTWKLLATFDQGQPR